MSGTDQLAEKLSKLRLASPTLSPTLLNNDHEFKVHIDTQNKPFELKYHYRVYMNTKDMVSRGLTCSDFIKFHLPLEQNPALVLQPWPNASTLNRQIRISSLLAKKLSLEDVAVLRIIPYKDVIPTSSSIQIKFVQNTSCSNSHALTDVEKALILRNIQEIACIQKDCEYSLEISPLNFLNFTVESVECFDLFRPPVSNSSYIFAKESENSSLRLDDQYKGFKGFEAELNKITRTFSLALKYSEQLEKVKIKPPRGILLYGPPGTGKSTLAKLAAHHLGLSLIKLNDEDADSSLMSSSYYGEAEMNVRKTFERALLSSPSILFIDEIDSICPRRDKSTSASDNRIVATLLTLMDGISSDSKVFFLATTNSPNSIDPALRRPGRFDEEIELSIPNANQRTLILKDLLQDEHKVTIESIEALAEKAHGFVGADLSLLVKEATLLAIKENRTNLTDNDLALAFGRIKPSAIREVAIEVPHISWNDIGGQGHTKRLLKESVELPLRDPGKFIKFGIRPPRGVLLYGPPGCSKTMLAKAVATESGLNFLAIKGPEIFSKWVGDSEKAISEIFRKARLAAPSVIFFDEFDAIGKKRSDDAAGEGASSVSDRVLSQLLSEMDGIDPLTNVTVLAATNRPDIIDPALMRPGRFDRHIYVPLPDNDARACIFLINKKQMPFADDIDIPMLVELTRGFSGAEISALCQEAAFNAFATDQNAKCINVENFLASSKSVTPRTSSAMIQFYETYFKEKTIE